LKEVSSLVSYPLISSVMNSIPAAPFSWSLAIFISVS
jgi:hypothetical protein